MTSTTSGGALPAPVGTAWSALERHAEQVRATHLRDWFATDPGRARRFSAAACGLYVDFSKHRATDETFELLRALLAARGLESRRRALFAGEHVNGTEDRAALHMALRRAGGPFPGGGGDVMKEVLEVRERMLALVDELEAGRRTGHAGDRIETVVNIGIGGSDLGPAMAADALRAHWRPGIDVRFVSNLDSTHLHRVLAGLEPRSTMFVIASKTFGTEETLTNAASARRWLLDWAGDEAAVARHFVAVSTRLDRTTAFGIAPENVFGFWDWVGGRYSMWSAIGLPVAAALGRSGFEALLAGAAAMDTHFLETPPERNLPVVLGSLGVWYRNFHHAQSHAVLAYDYALHLLPAHLQQVEMESNGKCVSHDGAPLPYRAAPVIWGGAGNNGQHAYYQKLHQGGELVPTDFLVAARGQCEMPGHQEGVLANALAQAEALMIGRTLDEARAELAGSGLAGTALERAAAHRVMPGNQPSTTIVYERLTPEVLGTLVALYEHKVFVQSVLWDVNAFDQWGVELGKALAGRIRAELSDVTTSHAHDASTAQLLNRVRRLRGG